MLYLSLRAQRGRRTLAAEKKREILLTIEEISDCDANIARSKKGENVMKTEFFTKEKELLEGKLKKLKEDYGRIMTD
jgi:hypothetical protein